MAQLTDPSHNDWVSQVLKDLEDLSIELEVEEIKSMKKHFYKKIVKEAVQKEAFLYLQKGKEGRNSENAKGKKITYDEFVMAEYLYPNEEGMSIDDKKWLFKCRVEDVNVKANHRWKHDNIMCSSCMKNEIETQKQILFCDSLLGKNKNISYLPDYEELYNGDLKEQIYVSRLLRENFNNRVPDV